ncbi:MAG: DUF4143 domain-containing protein [bacterium]
MISERIKLLRNHGIDRQFYFWRTLSRQEIDYVEEEAGFIRAFEIKWKENRLRIPKPFSDAYPKAECSIINNKNFKEFIGKL